MSDRTSIEWTDATYNPVTGCTKVSPGCKSCYAERIAKRLWAHQYPPVTAPVGQFASGLRPRAFSDVQCHPERLDAPLRWRQPRRIFVVSMGDLFHEAVPDEFIAQVYAVMLLAHWHTHQTLTKRTGRQLSLLSDPAFAKMVGEAAFKIDPHGAHLADDDWPLKNVHVGASVEDDKHLWRVSDLLATPAAVRFLSLEPLLGAVDLEYALHMEEDCECCPDCGWEHYGASPCDPNTAARVDGVIVGAESGPGARPFDENWVRGIRDQCIAAGVTFMYKQRLENGRKVSLPELDGRVWAELPGV